MAHGRMNGPRRESRTSPGRGGLGDELLVVTLRWRRALPHRRRLAWASRGRGWRAGAAPALTHRAICVALIAQMTTKPWVGALGALAITLPVLAGGLNIRITAVADDPTLPTSGIESDLPEKGTTRRDS